MIQLQQMPVYMLEKALRRHRYKVLWLAGTALMIPLLPVGVRGIYSVYQVSYRFYYVYAILSAIQGSTCNWVSTPQVMCLNAAINYLFDPDTANDIIKGVFWFSCKVVKAVQFCAARALDSVGGLEGIYERARLCRRITAASSPRPVSPAFSVTFAKTDFDFIDIHLNTFSDNPQEYDLCYTAQPVVFESQSPPQPFSLEENYIASI